MTDVKILLNQDRDGMVFGYESSHEMEEAFEFQLEQIIPEYERIKGFVETSQMLEKIYLVFNGVRQHNRPWVDQLQNDYYFRGNRSLSKGDVVIVNGQAFAVMGAGFGEVDGFNEN